MNYKPDPSQWGIEVIGIEKRFRTRKGLPPGYSLGAAHWLISNLIRLRRKPVYSCPLDKVDLKVERGELLGLLGPNGAGKTTLIKCLSTLLEPDGGSAFVNGFDIRTEADQVRRSINLVGSGHWVAFDWNLSIEENLHFFGTLFGLNRHERRKRIASSLELLRLSHLANETPRTLSTGERQRMLLAKSFMVQAPVAFLDEPTVGLDANGSREVRNFIQKELVGCRGISGILTTHRLAEAESLCRRIAIMNQGKIIACGTPSELKRLGAVTGYLEVRVTALPSAAVERVKGLRGVKAAVAFSGPEGSNEARLRVRCISVESVASDIIEIIRSHEGRVIAMEPEELSLEDVYLSLIESKVAWLA
jgi:ABC-2 type transport system ATP-binding protein